MSRHAYRSDESYRGVEAGPRRSPAEELSRRAAVLSVVLAVVLPGLLLGGWLVADNRPFWGQPDVSATVVGSRADGMLSQGRSTCDASRFTVASADGRRGSFRECEGAYGVGDVTAARWSRFGRDLVSVDAMDPGPIALLSTAFGALFGIVVGCSIRAERRREQRRRSNTYRIREAAPA